MASFSDQIDRIASNALNGGTGDPVPGNPAAATSGLISIPYDGQLGKRYVVSGIATGSMPESLRLSATGVGTLYGGIYQYVLFIAGATAANVRGQIVFWSDVTVPSVTGDVTSATQGLIAGITLAPIAKGNYGWIQIAGIASVLFGATITKAVPAAGDLVFVNQTPTDRADILADATTVTSPIGKSQIGVAYLDVPAANTVSRVLLKPLGMGAAF